MEDKQKVYIKGDLERGNEVIKFLEDLGGKNTQNHQGNISDAYYFINPDGVICNTFIVGGIICPYIKEFYKEIKLPRWKPGYREKFFYIKPTGIIGMDVYYGTNVNKSYYEFGNCFKTIEEAGAARDKIREMLKQ